MQKKVEFYHNKGIIVLKLGFTSPNLASICLQSSTIAKIYQFTESDEELFSKVREDIFGGPSIVFTYKADVDETHIRKSTNVWTSFVGIDAGQFYPYSMCQPMPTGLYSRFEFDADMQILKPRQNKSFENMIMSHF